MPSHQNQNVQRAHKILAGEAPQPDELENLADTLKTELEFGLARRLLQNRFDEEDVQSSGTLKLKIGGQLALCTYKDPELPLEERLDEALKILQRIGTLATTTDPETLGFVGAIYKRRWEALARRHDLECSLSFYLRGYEQGRGHGDHWYPGINAAFVLDLLAAQQAMGGLGEPAGNADTVQARLAQAARIRTEILQFLDEDASQTQDWWRLATRAEALFGLGKFQQAESVIESAVALPNVPDWYKESTARQLASLARLRQNLPIAEQDPIETSWRVLSHLVDDNLSAAVCLVRGRIGLALSGGGFRASLFHVGVLARLAELDLLRGVECLSCVSGGSIIGAHYYLHVRRLLRNKPDSAITAADYIAIVEKVAEEFLAGVQRNIRTRVAAEWKTNLKMMFFPHYSRTLRVGELYESELFKRVDDGESNEDRWLNDLMIMPPDAPPNFKPKTHNWKRTAKVPNLILNATTLNTGHNWQFTASWMGEPPAGATQIDANVRLRRLYHEEAPPEHRRTRLGYAVAASSCVPGLFEPLPLVNLYPDRLLGLVDGGVHDNQGTSALLEQDCNVLIVSDASGQMDTIDISPSGLLSVPLRANSILQARVREAQFREVMTRRTAGLLSGLVILHLKKDLDVETVDWVDCQDPSEQPSRNPVTKYGVQKKVQRQLAAIRTDLDSFSDTEGYALMTSGYLMASEALLAPNALGFPPQPPDGRNWKFLCIQPLMAAPSTDKSFFRQLTVAEQIAFKVWRLSRLLQIGAIVVVFSLLALAVVKWGAWSGVALPKLTIETTLGGFMAGVLIAALAALLVPIVWQKLRFAKTLQQIAIGFAMVTFGFLVARIHLHVFDWFFLTNGRRK